MVVVGGATRLTGSGLSITEWKPIMGAIPPLTDAAWQEAFEKYQSIPQYKLVNAGMALAEWSEQAWLVGSFASSALLVTLVLALRGDWR